MMKYAEMNERQKKAFKNVKYAAYYLLGGLENTLSDYDESDEEYVEAKNLLSDRDALINEVYSMATSCYYREGLEGFGPQWQSLIKDIKFCGKEFLMSLVEDRLAKEGY